MDTDKVEGKAQNGAGALEAAAGKALNDPGMQASGEIRQFRGKLQDAAGAAKDTMAKSAETAKRLVSTATTQAGGAYGDMRQRAKQVADTVDPFVKEQPYAALAVAAVAGLVLGMLFFGGGAKVVYVKPARD